MRRFPSPVKLVLTILVPAAIAWLLLGPNILERRRAEEVVRKTWAGFKRLFINADGRVHRLPENDTVSEGQAYAMLRAVWLGDKETFDRCYRWTEENLSRRPHAGDNLLAWHWKDGQVRDWMPAADADLDYALSLFFADALWPGAAPSSLPPYDERAARTAEDVLRKLTYESAGGRLYLSPWILAPNARPPLPVNPSYYSPSHFRVFFDRTGDKRWLSLVDTTYHVLGSLARGPGTGGSPGLVPDWCGLERDERFLPLAGRSSDFGWDALRVAFRVGWDAAWFKSPEAEAFFRAGMADFIEREWSAQGAVYCEYGWDAASPRRFEDPTFYASYYHALASVRSKTARDILHKTRSFLAREDGEWHYGRTDYYANSLSWLADGMKSGLVRNIPPRGRR
ncbi:MAG: hypothetical protein HY927_10870 [Elusimicrobia bacterium]|nr:hypothetical protein [Elusimicrobiota bacterium]